MKNLLFVLSFVFLVHLTLSSNAQSTLTGNWTGILYQNPSSGTMFTEYKFSMKLEEVNGVVKGVSTIIAGPNYGILDLKGSFKKDSLLVEEYLIEKEKLTQNFNWCLKKESLRLKTEGTKLKLEGNWTGYAMHGASRSECSPGRIVLTKEQGFISLKGYVVNEKTIKEIPAQVKITDKKTGKQVASLKTTTGEFDIALPGSNEYELTVEAKGFLTRYEHVTLSHSKILNIPLTPIEIGQTVAIPFILFEQSTSILTKDSYPSLDRLSKFLTANPGVNIELQGHTSNEGDAGKNLELSQQRVQTIKEVLVQKGINPSRINLKALGAQKPLVPNDTEANKKLNRRVEFLILHK